MQVKACAAAVRAAGAAAGVRDSGAVRAVARVMLRVVDRVMLRAVGRVTRRAVPGMVRGDRVEAAPGTGRRVARASSGLL